MTDDMEKRTRQFIAIRDKIKQMEDEHKEKLKPLKQLQEVVAGRIQTFLEENNLKNLKTAAGTCYKKTRHTASLTDPDAFMNYVIEHKAFNLMDRRANSTAVQDFVKEHKALPPGCNLSAIATIGVQRGDLKEQDE